LNMSDWGDKFIIPFISENSENRNIVSTLYSFILESQDYIDSLTFRNNQDGTIEPFLLNLYKGCLIFESLLKFLTEKYQYKIIKKGKEILPQTLGDFTRINMFTSRYAMYETNASSWQDVKAKLNRKDLEAIFTTIAKLRNYSGHDLRRSNIFNNNSDYITFVNKIVDAVLIVITKEFFIN